MILTKTPLRISFLGGGTDFPWFCDNYGGAVISTSINRYIYISVLPSYDEKTTYLKYSKLETVSSNEDISHPIFRAVLVDYDIPPTDWSVMADIPAGNGLASSSAFTVGLLKTVHKMLNKETFAHELALEAVRVELDLLGEPIGLQDQFASAFGGLNLFQFQHGRNVTVRSLNKKQGKLPFDFVLVKVGSANRNAGYFTEAQHNYVLANPKSIDDLVKLRDLTIEAAEEIEKDFGKLATYTRAGWELKLRTNPSTRTEEISESLALAMRAGAEAGKLVGAGGSGFLLLIVDPDHTEKLMAKFRKRKQKVFRVQLDELGSQVVNHD